MAELIALPVVVDLRTAARALHIGQNKAYRMARAAEFPCRVERAGHEYRVARADLFRELGLDPTTGAHSEPAAVQQPAA